MLKKLSYLTMVFLVSNLYAMEEKSHSESKEDAMEIVCPKIDEFTVDIKASKKEYDVFRNSIYFEMTKAITVLITQTMFAEFDAKISSEYENYHLLIAEQDILISFAVGKAIELLKKNRDLEQKLDQAQVDSLILKYTKIAAVIIQGCCEYSDSGSQK
ncbi:hypothetical protein M1446_03425 [Candidatus Dependentiae bacterium]|nr:hypothetical protein [Candidatus Dependentiae bacterium]